MTPFIFSDPLVISHFEDCGFDDGTMGRRTKVTVRLATNDKIR